MGDPVAAPPRRRRRWTLSIRGLILLVLVSGSVIGWKANRVHATRRAIAAVREHGGFVVYDYECVDGKLDASRKSWVPLRLREWLGDEFFHDVAAVWFISARGLGDKDLAILKQFDNLRTLEINNAHISNAGLATIGELPRLRRLVVRDADITDAGLVHINKLHDLRELQLSGVPITDIGLVHISGLRHLTHLALWQTDISEAAVSVIGKLEHLKSLELLSTKITGNGLSQLSGLRELEELKVIASEFDDDAVNHLNLFPNLKVLHFAHGESYCDGKCHLRFEAWTDMRELSVTRLASTVRAFDVASLANLEVLRLTDFVLGDDDLKSVPQLKKLKTLELYSDHITSAGMAELMKTMPSLKVIDAFGDPYQPRGKPHDDDIPEIPESMPDGLPPPPKE